MSELKSSIPKFGSFKPGPGPVIQDQVEKEASKGRDHDQNDSTTRHEPHKSRKTHSKAQKRDTSTEQRSEGARRELVETKQRPLVRENFDERYIVDKSGDVKNLVYGSNHRYSIPPFHRSGAGSVLGVPSFLRIDRNYADESGIFLSDRRGPKSRHREKYIFSRIEKHRSKLLKIRPDVVSQNSVEKDYISFRSSRGGKRKSGSDGGSGTEDGEADYRSVYGKAMPNDELEDDEFQYATEGEFSGSENGRMIELNAGLTQKAIELSQRVEQSPNDVAAWLALIEHQDTLLRGDRRRITNAELRSITDIKIHMCEQALERVRSLEDRETLLLRLMAEASKTWELKAQSERWESILKNNTSSFLLWKSYLNFRQTTFGTFQYEDIREIFVQKIKFLSHLANVDNTHSRYDQILYILLRLTTFMRESGYTELAVAIWQGLLEFNLFTPPRFLEPAEKFEPFRQFWESEIPRIGENAALGWRHFVEDEVNPDAPDPLNDVEGNTFDDRHVFRSWTAAEQSRAKVSQMPARTMDDVVEDDPFRVILVSDIKEFLVSIPIRLDELRKSMVDAFLLFCRLPPLTSTVRTSMTWPSDPFIVGTLLECDRAWIERQYLEGEDVNGELQVEISSIFKVPTSNFQNSPESMFSVSWFKSMRSWRDIYNGDNGPVQYGFIRKALQQMLHIYYREDLAEYYLTFEWRNEPETIKKISKTLLKQHPSSLRLYNAYAMIEWSRGNIVLANSVYSAALDMAESMPENVRDSSILLWKSWIWGHLEGRDNTAAISRILLIESGTPNQDISSTPFQLLKAKQHLSRRRDYHLYSGSMLYAILYAECIALLEYLTSTPSHNEPQSSNQGNIAVALEVFTSFSHTLQQVFKNRNISDTSFLELHLQSAARLLYHHVATGPFRPALLREHLTNYLTLFPQNTIFLSLYACNESRLRIDNRVRNILSTTVLNPACDTLSSRLFGIYYEMTHGTIHSVRSSFEHALGAPSSKSSPGLWRLYILYALRTPQFRSRAKDIWYRAIRACPWAKELYMTGFENMDDVEEPELIATWRVMGEKGLRVHVDLEDALVMRK